MKRCKLLYLSISRSRSTSTEPFFFNQRPQRPATEQIPFHQHNEEQLAELYPSLKQSVYEKQLEHNLNNISLGNVFSNNELDLSNINAFGFEYDYTIALYSQELQGVLYKMAVDALVKEQEKNPYPNEISRYKYDCTFPIRGLHFDTKMGYLMKLSSTNRVQLGTVHKGYKRIDDFEVLKEYGGTLINIDLMSMDGSDQDGEDTRIFQRLDSFSKAFLSLLTNVIDYFMQERIEFNPSYMYHDVHEAIGRVYSSGILHQTIVGDLDRYLPKRKGLETYFNRLLSQNKKLFLITNSPFPFVDKGMSHLFHKDWRDMFEVVCVNARKPKFFRVKTETSPFRNINLSDGTYMSDQVLEFQRHGVYGEGNVDSLKKYAGLGTSEVIYFGNQVHSDLIDPVERVGWRTGAVVPELESEIKIVATEGYIKDIEWLLTLENLIQVLQVNTGSESNALLRQWKKERKILRRKSKHLFNPYFGSMFRTFENPTSFSSRIRRYADLYMSSVENMANYSDDFHFLPVRNLMPHERKSWIDF